MWRNAFWTFLLLVAPSIRAGAQPAKLTVNGRPAAADNTAIVEPGKAVVLGVSLQSSKNTKLSWTKEGEGDFTTETIDQNKVSFLPRSPGDVIVITCEISSPKGHERPTVTLRVAGDKKADSSKTPQRPKPDIDRQAPPPPSATAGDLLISEMEDVTPAGWQGDAISDNGNAAAMDSGNTTGCYVPKSSCIRIDYAPEKGKLGWAAFAYQRTPEGGMNWGQSPGVDLTSGRFLSFRVRAKAQAGENGSYPKIKVQSGGNVAKEYASTNRASYTVASATIQLSNSWQEVCISLRDKDLSNVVSPFTAIITKAGFPKGGAIFLDDARFSREGCSTHP